jgi:DNA-binding winged helix-turn-helix (wHTH) protein
MVRRKSRCPQETILQLQQILQAQSSHEGIKLTPNQRTVVDMLLVTNGICSNENLYAALYVSKQGHKPDPKILREMLRLIRRQLKPHAIEIKTVFGKGYTSSRTACSRATSSEAILSASRSDPQVLSALRETTVRSRATAPPLPVRSIPGSGSLLTHRWRGESAANSSRKMPKFPASWEYTGNFRYYVASATTSTFSAGSRHPTICGWPIHTSFPPSARSAL